MISIELLLKVAPGSSGAWIEIDTCKWPAPVTAGRTRIIGCVDWNDISDDVIGIKTNVAPGSSGAWIEMSVADVVLESAQPGRTRIIGCVDWNDPISGAKKKEDKSHPDHRVRGLKYQQNTGKTPQYVVASGSSDAWIEMTNQSVH